MAEQRYYVIGGEYADTSFTTPAAGTQLKTHGPFTERDAKVFWRSITGRTVDNAMVRYFLKDEDQLNGKIYWVVGGEYANSNFQSLAAGKEIEVYGPFEKWEALGFWRGLTSKSVDDAMVRYDIRKNYQQGDGGGGKFGVAGVESSGPLATCITKSITIAAVPARVFSFLMDGSNWPKWAIHNITSVKALDDGSWEFQGPHGKGQFKLTGDASSGVIDEVFIDHAGTWRVPGRVMAVPGGCVVAFVFAKPADFSDDAFQAGMKQLDDEMAALKKVLEAK